MSLDQHSTPIVVLFSGGINSTVAAARFADGSALHFVHVHHGQPAAAAEREAARKISDAMAGTLHVVDLIAPSAGIPTRVAPGAKTDSEAGPAAGGASPTRPSDSAGGGLMFTLAGLALRVACRVGADTITCGVSQVCDEHGRTSRAGHGDPQRGRIFHRALAIAVEMASTPRRRATWETPFIQTSRVEIVRTGLHLGAPFHLSWSCESAGPKPCDRCRGCRSRAEGFEAIGQADPRLAVAR